MLSSSTSFLLHLPFFLLKLGVQINFGKSTPLLTSRK
uniref:Uncharacterized protein n=1 Tax=Setaria viridis TaxID=4556 RepID=A0A4U6W3T2_SETVI|nr:hypothetical protein SEVIR_1G020950v2 [Setaria viridis]